MIAMIPTMFSWLADGTVLIALPVIAFLTAMPSTRRYGGIGLFVVSYLFAIFLWISSSVAVYHFWGKKVLAVGMLFLGVGPIFMSPVLCVTQGLWPDLACFIVLSGLFFVARKAGSYLLGPTMQDSDRTL